MQNIYQRIAVRQYWIPLVTSRASWRSCWGHLLIYTSSPYPLYVHRIIKVDSILYQKFAFWTYSPFRHIGCHLYILVGIINLEFQLKYVDNVISNLFNLNKHFSFFFFFLSSSWSHQCERWRTVRHRCAALARPLPEHQSTTTLVLPHTHPPLTSAINTLQATWCN